MFKSFLLSIFLISASTTVFANDLYNGWSPELSQVEKNAIVPSKDTPKIFELKSEAFFRGLKCPGGAQITSSDKKAITIEMLTGCYLDKIGKEFKFRGKIIIKKNSFSHIDKFIKLVGRVREQNIKELNFVVGYDSEIESRLKKLGLEIKNYVVSELLPKVHSGAMQITLLEKQDIKGFLIPSKSDVILVKNDENGKDELGLIYTHGSSVKLNELSCTTFGLGDSDSVSCVISEKITIGDINFPDGTQFEIDKKSVGKEKLNILSAGNSSREIKISDEVVPRDHTIIFSNSTYKVVPPPKE